ncbi:MAG: hypothetical protein AUK63_1287 [bacterium P3]|nr:MAG: hypothetical protein AUK63_1287 [bacterium P3]KWW40395.1 MAG: hypothetical protein F083_1632 [bacterium F083]
MNASRKYRMISIGVLLTALTAGGMTGMAQCPGWHNPSSFVTNNNQFFYSGKVIGSCSSSWLGTVGVGPEYYTNVALTGASDLATVTATGCYSLSLPDGAQRFVIKGAGFDPNTANAISFLPRSPGGLYYTDNSGLPYSSSIRVGTECTNGAEVLYYQMKVNTQNCLLTLWYAPVVQTPTTHDQYENSALILRVTKKQGNDWVLLDTRYEYIVSGQPRTASFPSGLVDGENGWHHRNLGGYNDVWYKDWTKAIISLDQFLDETVRIEIYMSACKYNAHYAYCYIAGDYQPMQITSSGCPAGSSTVVDTLRAPKDMMSYTWYRSTTAFDIRGYSFDLEYLDTTSTGLVRTILYGVTQNDTILWERVENGNEREYLVQADDFIPTSGPYQGQTVGVQSFMCKMTSYIDPTKPFESFVYQRVENNKPQLKIDTVLSCDNRIELHNLSTSPNRGLDSTRTRWYIYRDETASDILMNVLQGNVVEYSNDEAGTYYAKLWVSTEDDSTCYTEGVFPIRVLTKPHAVIGALPDDQPCIGDEIAIIDSTYMSEQSRQYENWRREWTVGNETIYGDSTQPNNRLLRSFNEQTDITLATRNGLYYTTEEADTVWCADTTSRTIYVFSSPNLTVSDDTIVCKGNQTQVHVAVDVDGELSYAWYEHLDLPGENAVATGNTLRITPPDEVEKKTYYVKVTRQPQGCVAWDSVTIRVIKPTIHQSRSSICQGETVTLWGENAHHYSWAAAPGDESLMNQIEQQTVVVSPSSTTTYTLIGHGSDDCTAMPVSTTVEVIPYPVPTVSLSPAFIDSEDPQVTFQDNSPFSVASEWRIDALTAYGAQLTHRFEDLNRDSVSVSLYTSNALGCTADTTFYIPIQRFTTWFPNAFTPNKPDNKYFSVSTINQLEHFNIIIYDRRGMQVFTSDDQNFAWDGTMEGERCPQGVYVFFCRYRRPGTSDLIQRTGTVTLLR